MDERVWIETRQRLHAFVAARLSPPSAVEDVVQDVLLKMIRGIGDLTDADRLNAWAYRIARNAIIDEYRRRDRRTGLLDQLPPADALSAGDLTADPLLLTDQIELEGCLQPMVEQLDDRYRQAIQLTGWDGLTTAQAAAAAGVSLSAMKARVRRGRLQLRQQLTACCEVELDERGLHGAQIDGGGCAEGGADRCGCGVVE